MSLPGVPVLHRRRWETYQEMKDREGTGASKPEFVFFFIQSDQTQHTCRSLACIKKLTPAARPLISGADFSTKK